MKKTKKTVVVASFAAACTLFAGVGFAAADETPAPGSTPVVSAQANYDRSALQTQHDRAVTLRDANSGKLSQYTQSSWTHLLSDIDTAEAKLDSSKDGNFSAGGAASQSDVNSTASSIKTDLDLGILQAPQAGDIKADAPLQTTASLQSFYNKVKDVVRSSYPSASNDKWSRFDASRSHARWTASSGSDQYSVTRAYDDLYKDTYNLDQSLLPTSAPAPGQGGSSTPAPAPVDKKAGLRSAYDKVKDYKQSDFTAASPWAAFDAERTVAKALLDSASPTDEALAAETTALNTKSGALISIAGLKADLAKAATLKPADYTEFTWYLVTLDVPYAQSIVDDANATQEDVSTAQSIFDSDLAGLKAPIAGQKTGADVPTTPKTKEDLSGLVAQAETLKQADYTADSWKVFADALKDAKEALNPDAQSQLLRDGGDYTFNYVELEDAQSALVRNASQQQGQGGAGAGAAGNKSGLAQTGASVSIVAGIMALLAAAAAAIKLVDRKRA
ncbi:MAG: FIVAR domain-containing protein [Bifidobacterium sp.]|nr:FIVAR domain-containing protein [Bifidobacterium sp.]